MKANVELSLSGRTRLVRRLEALLEERGLSRRKLAISSRVGLGTVNGIASGRREPNLSTMLALAEALGLTSIEQLIGPSPTQGLIGEVRYVRSSEDLAEAT